MKKNTRGFTLIELLVVIAIIGILSSVVLVSLNSARAKGKDAKLMVEMNGLRTVLETGYTTAYNTTLLTTTATSMAITAGTGDALPYVASILQAGNTADNALRGEISGTAFIFYARLPSKPAAGVAAGDIYCVDSVGYSGPTKTPVTLASHFSTTADLATFTCP